MLEIPSHLKSLFVQFDLDSLDGLKFSERRLSDLANCFADPNAYAKAIADGNPLLYRVASFEPRNGDGQLHYGLGILEAGKVGAEYYLTKGHLHSYRPAAEVYLGLRGEGMMLLEEENGEAYALPLRANSVVYVPGHTAHRTMNTGSEPLVYIGVYPSNAGHDYGTIAERNFQQVVVEVNGAAVVMKRDVYLKSLEAK